MAVAGRVEEQGRLGEQRVEPAAGLVDRLADEVGREALLEQLLVLERVVELGERHRAGVEPGVDRLDDPPHLRPAGLAAQDDLVDVGPVQVVGHLAAALAQVGHRPGAEALLAVGRRALPDRQRRAPVALARERPVDVVLEPLAEAAVLDVLRMPVDLLVGGQQPVADLRGRDVPARLRVVEERRVAAPAVRVGVEEGLGAEQAAALLERLDDVGVGLLDEAARRSPVTRSSKVPSALTGFCSLIPYCSPRRKSSSPKAIAVWTSPVPSSVRDEVGLQHGVAAGAVVGDVVERRLVGGAGERRAGEVGEHLGLLAEHLLDQVRATTRPRPPSRARTYSISGPTATAALEISVQGVVVQTSSWSPGSSGDSGIRRSAAPRAAAA